jgi:hypothetical protein
MKYLKLFEAKKTYAQKSKELFDKFDSLIDEESKIEVEDVMRSIFDITGSPTETRFVNWRLKDNSKNGNTRTMYHDVDSYKYFKLIYDRLLLDDIDLDYCLCYDVYSIREEILPSIEDEVVYVKETLESMGYEFIYKNPASDISIIRFMVIKKDVDASSIIEEKEYYSSLPKSIIKPFGLFMMQYKVPDEKAEEFANLLGSADWSKE